jgi:glycosyltransferase involved in cell wall biosynthesis
MLLEVASLKIPIIASNIIQNRDVFTENEVAFFELENIDDLSFKIKHAFENYEEMLNKAENAYAKLVIDYNWDSIAKEYYKEYIQVI